MDAKTEDTMLDEVAMRMGRDPMRMRAAREVLAREERMVELDDECERLRSTLRELMACARQARDGATDLERQMAGSVLVSMVLASGGVA